MNNLHFPRFLANGQVFMVCIILVLSFAVFRSCDFSVPLTATQKEAEKASLEEQQTRWAEQRQDRQKKGPFNLALFVITRLAVLALGVGAALGLLTTLTLKGWAWACQIKPVGGLFPGILSKAGGQWQVHDMNKQVAATMQLGDGAVLCSPGWEQAQMLVTAGAQRIQQEQAHVVHAEHLTLTDKRQMSELAAGEPAPVAWPGDIYLADLLQRQGGADLDKIILGTTPNDSGQWEVVTAPMTKMVHVGVGSSSGFGKSTMLHSLLSQFVQAGNIKLALADSEGSTLGKWRDCNLLEWPFAEHADEITALFIAVGKELDHRAELYTLAGHPNSLKEYNTRRGDLPELEPLALVADEANSILKSNPAASAAAESLAYRGRKFGLWLILSGQRWTGADIPTGLKNQLSTRVGFKMTSKAQSNNLLMCPDAADLPEAGCGLVLIPGRQRMQVKAPIVTDDEIAALLTGHSGARQPAPVVVDVTPEQAPNSLTDSQRARIVELGRGGKSVTGIVKTVWGSKNGRRAKQVRAILDSDAVTG